MFVRGWIGLSLSDNWSIRLRNGFGGAFYLDVCARVGVKLLSITPIAHSIYNFANFTKIQIPAETVSSPAL